MFLKLFKNVVAEDLEMLLPYVRIRMRLLDHVKIGSSVVGGVATAILKAFTAAILSPWVMLLILSGFLWSAIRSVYSFFSSKTKYMQALSSNLYFQNFANNTSALTQLVDYAETEECKELLAGLLRPVFGAEPRFHAGITRSSRGTVAAHGVRPGRGLRDSRCGAQLRRQGTPGAPPAKERNNIYH